MQKLVSSIEDVVDSKLYYYRNCMGGKVKWGLSLPSYISLGSVTDASFDGRRKGDPLMTHISSKGANAYTEIINFASWPNYNGVRSNGNVIDFFASPTLFNESFEKFYRLIKRSISAGFFQMQMNVADSKMLIDAKHNPEKYPDIIVRVWGFSAYFSDLPESYKNLLIERALQGEGLSY